MYIPKYSSITDLEFLKLFILNHGFGMLVNSSKNELSANHYPFLLTEDNGEIVLWTHLARNNPQWQELSREQCLVIFTGPQAYISPSYYVNNLNVPTWNYTAVHAKCEAEVISDNDLEKELMKRMVQFYENRNQTNWNYHLPEDFHDKLLKAIVWIKLKVISLDGKFKLSQNRDQIDYDNLTQILSSKKSDNDKELLKYMKLTNPFQEL